MIKPLIVASSILVLTACSTMPGTTEKHSHDLDPNANCLTEMMRIENDATISEEEGGEMMFDYWKTEKDVLGPFVRAVAIQQKLPLQWRDQFEAKVNDVFSYEFLMYCAASNNTVKDASLLASKSVDAWLDAFVEKLSTMKNRTVPIRHSI